MSTPNFSLRPGISRREAMRLGLAGSAGLLLSDRILTPTFAAAPVAKAKAVIQIWMWGGPCHLDTFDPKPDAGTDFCGPLKSPIATNVDGVRICELLPRLAKQADKYSIIRSMTHSNNGHETASYMVQTGHKPGDSDSYPCMGAVVSHFKGYDAGYKGLIPPYIVLTQPQGRFSEAGFLGSRHKPFATGGDPAKTPFVVEGVVAPGISEEKPELRERYGPSTFGQSCLMARRLVERGVPYVTINYNGWDTHKQHFQAMNRKLPELDQGFATLLEDLSERGLLDSTIVWWGGEFGRTPRVQWEAPWGGGRNHFGKVFNSVVAGGGFKGGHVVGASDKTGEEVAERPVSPTDLIGSMYDLLGIDTEATLPHPQGAVVKVMPAGADGIATGGRLREIMS